MAVAPNTVQRPDERWVDNGRIVTSAGVSAGINMSRYVVGKLLGAAQADETAHYMEYEHWHGMPVEEWKREASTEKTRRANFPIVDDARERDQGELAATFRSYMMLVSFLSGVSTHLGPLASTLCARAGEIVRF